jgi:hypothetical protein
MFNKDNYRVYFHHFPSETGKVPYPYTQEVNSDLEYKGRTECVILKDEEEVSLGEAYCSLHDNFSRFAGRYISFTRAVWGLDKEVRSLLWEEYKKLGGV